MENRHHNCGVNYKIRKLYYGVGVNDSDYVTQGVDGTCPYFSTWRGVIQRCYDPIWHKKHPSYKGTKVSEEWLVFSNFKMWMETQDWKGKQLDKDLLGDGKLYSKETCCFLPKMVNSFLVRSSRRGGKGLPVGVYKSKKRFQASCNNPYGGGKYIGNYACPTKAHFEYLKVKQSIAKKIAAGEKDPRISEAILKRFSVW